MCFKILLDVMHISRKFISKKNRLSSECTFIMPLAIAYGDIRLMDCVEKIIILSSDNGKSDGLSSNVSVCGHDTNFISTVFVVLS